MENNEFKGSTKQSLKHLSGDIQELKDELKEFYNKNEKDHKEIFTAITEIQSTRIPWKFWGAIGAALIASFTSIFVVVMTVIF